MPSRLHALAGADLDQEVARPMLDQPGAHWAVEFLAEDGAGARLERKGTARWGINIGINRDPHRIDFKKTCGQACQDLRPAGGNKKNLRPLARRRRSLCCSEVDKTSCTISTAPPPKIGFSP